MNKYTYTPPCTKEELQDAYCQQLLSQCECAEKFGASQKSIWRAMKKFNIPARKAAKRNQYGEANHSWKGDKASKYAMHRRLYSRHGKPCKCSRCGTTDKSAHYDYANLTGNYNLLEDYEAMCRSCHWKYDKKINNITKGGGSNENS